MNVYEALMITGRLEIQLEGNEKSINELKKIQKCIIEKDFVNLAISLGRLSELSKGSIADADKSINALTKFITNKEEVTEQPHVFDMTIEDLNLSDRSLNCMKRAGFNMVSDILRLSGAELYRVKQLCKNSYEEVLDRLEALGQKSFVEKTRALIEEYISEQLRTA